MHAGKPVVCLKTLCKLLLIMKLTLLLTCLCCFQVYSSVFSQDRISLSLKDAGIKEALTAIQQRSDYRFIYNDAILPAGVRVTMDVEDIPVKDALARIFEPTQLVYKVLDNKLVSISLASPEPDAALTITGRVRLRTEGNNFAYSSGISVKEAGTNNGTVTNEKGEFTLSVAGPGAVLVISHIGYSTQQVPVNNNNNIEITLETDAQQLTGVVVTALGISRQKKALSYSTQTLKGSDLSGTRETNLSSALTGKVAGLTINKTNAGPGSSNRIIFRGNRSIAGNNQPLIIVDGVRIDNMTKAVSDVSMWGARDNGDGISNINPDDVASMTVLTGASAAALYGSDASNGAIIITTRKGRIGPGIGVDVSSSVMFENPMIYPEMQNIYGQGNGGVFNEEAEQSWGPKMTGQKLQDWTGKTQALVPQPDNYKKFFRTGSELMNSVSLSAGNERSQTYFSYTNTLSKGIIPNNDFRRNNLNLRQTVQFNDKLSLDAKANYISEDVFNRQRTGEANRAVASIYRMPRSMRLNDVKNFETTGDDGMLRQLFWHPGDPKMQNPYWTLYRNLYTRSRDRFIGLLALKYQITSFLSIQYRSSIDYYADRSEEKDYNDSYWIEYPGKGNYEVGKESNRQFNNDILINLNKDLSEKLNLNVNAGASLEQFNFEGTNTNSQGMNAPNLFSLDNAVSSSSINTMARTEKQSIYAAAQLSYNNYLFLDVTGRNDWNSTLPASHRSYFFPSAGLSAVLSDMLKLPAVLSFLKARASYAFVGNGTQFNMLNPALKLVPGGNGGFLLLDRTLRNADLKPEQTRSFEAGIELGMFNNRFNVEATYYKTNTINQILQIDLPNPSGYGFRIINAGNIQNKGMELLINAKPISSEAFKWSITLNYGANTNKVLKLDSLQKRPALSSPDRIGVIVAEEGRRYGEIYTRGFQRNEKNEIIVGSNGLPLVTEKTHYAGNFNPDWTGGITNSFQYRNLALSFLIDMRKGGVVVSHMQALLAADGASPLTLANRETGFVIPNSVREDGSKNATPVKAEDYWQQLGGTGDPVGELFTYDATNIRLREVSLSYTFPSRLLQRTFFKSAMVSLVGRNLFFIKNNAYGFDPESALGTGNNQGIEYASLPSTRNYGVYIKFSF